MKKIAIMTSGGDAPGMNAAIRAVVRSGFHYGMEVYGIYEGYRGLCEGKLEPLTRQHVSRIINRGGTILGSARYKAFKEQDVQEKAAALLKERGIEGLVVIGGDGSYRGALALHRQGIKTIGLPGTIDNDIDSTEFTIGFYTALETAMEAIDRLRDTSYSHHRCSVVELMGRHCGDLALYAGIAVGSEFIITPETGYDEARIIQELNAAYDRKKRHAIVVVTEKMTDVHSLAQKIAANTPYEARATVLGHIQRGGSPVAFDRVMAIEMGEHAVALLDQGIGGQVIGLKGMEIMHYPIEEALEMVKPIPNKRYGFAGRLREKRS